MGRSALHDWIDAEMLKVEQRFLMGSTDHEEDQMDAQTMPQPPPAEARRLMDSPPTAEEPTPAEIEVSNWREEQSSRLRDVRNRTAWLERELSAVGRLERAIVTALGVDEPQVAARSELSG